MAVPRPDLEQQGINPQALSWEQFRRVFQWKPGEHVIISGPAGSGKTTLGLWLAEQRNYCVVLGMKPRDDVLDDLMQRGWSRIVRWPAPPPDRRGKRQVILWPVTRSAQNVEKSRNVFRGSLRSIFEREGEWTVYVDELLLASDPHWYGLQRELDRIWAQGRSLRISLVTNTQRPSRIPPLAYTQITHLFMGQTADKRDVERLSEIGGLDRKSTIDLVSGLPRFTFLYRNTRDHTTSLVKAPKRA